ncbi:kinesin-like protein KIF9 [Colletes gigas]|uniref:kinesin-like protein KIF9 n=1 Tax=Colletes gigas TaxID=935657 RepID=UPI001C9B44CE|nr:kinesin-like protein KIF9 [Colletes gigas]
MTNYNDAKDCEKNVKIFVRILPLERFCPSYMNIDAEHKIQPNRIAVSRQPSYWGFQTDGIFLDSSQEEVYRVSTEDLVSKMISRHNLRVLDGVSCVLIGHGQTGSGKSFTISGLRNDWEHRGLVARLFTDLFAEKSSRMSVSKIEYRLSFVELRGKEARDLLSETENKIWINDRDPFKDILMVSVNTEEEALRKIFEGEVRRSVVKGSTYLTSHLATAVITVHATNISLITSWGIVTTAKVILYRNSHLAFLVNDKLLQNGPRFTSLRWLPVKIKEDVKYRPDHIERILQDEVDSLKKELMINDLFLRQEASMNISKSRMEQINRSIVNFLNGTISDFTLFSVSQATVLLKSIKDLYNRFHYSCYV